jgi:hypothetical protein
MRRYAWLFGATVVLALGLGALARRPHATPRAASPAAAAPRAMLALAVRDGALEPAVAAVAKDHRVSLVVSNRGMREARLALAGYEDRVTLGPLPPGESRRVEFVADRPGEDFAWLLDGRPAGRLAVQGSHLVEGHR